MEKDIIDLDLQIHMLKNYNEWTTLAIIQVLQKTIKNAFSFLSY